MSEDIDAAISPQHYQGVGACRTCGEPIEARDVSGGLMSFPGQALQYILRAGKKDSIIQEYRKAITFLQFEIERLERETRAPQG